MFFARLFGGEEPATLETVPAPPAGVPGHASGSEASGAPAPGFGVSVHHVGAIVEYYSTSQGNWILAKVVSANTDGTYDLDCKPSVPPERIRATTAPGALPPTTEALGTAGSLNTGGVSALRAEFEVGALVEYYSESQGGWILAKVLGFEAGFYNLDCKPGVPPGKVRRAPANAGGPVSTRGPVPAPRPLSDLPPAPTPAPPPWQETSSVPASHLGAGGASSAAMVGTPSVGDLLPSQHPTGGRPCHLDVKQDAPLQLVRVEREGDKWVFAVNDEAARVLEAYGRKPVAVCTVCGPYRTGKSYLLNLLLGRIQRGSSQFRVGSTSQACTQGLWMWGAGESGSSGSALVFMDCEGFGSTDSDKTRDAKLMSLCMLISSVFLLNTKGVINEGLFNALSLVCHLAEHMEERGQEASKPALLWLLRDFVLQLEDDSGRALSTDEYLERQLHQKPLAGTNAERSAAAVEVREHILRFFPQRHCATLVQPIIDEDKLRSLTEVPYTDLRMEFRKQFEAMQAQLMSMARAQPKMIAGHPLGGAALVALLRKLVDCMNSSQALNVHSAWEGVQHSACIALSDELRAAASDQLQRIARGGPLPVPGGPCLPVSDDVLAKAIEEGRRVLRQEWQSRALGDEAVRAEYWEDLQSAIAREEQALEAANAKVAEGMLREAGFEWEMWLQAEGELDINDPRAEALPNLLDRGVPARPAARAARDALNAARMARIRVNGTVSSLRSEKRLLESELASKVAAPAINHNIIEDKTLEQIGEAGRLKGQVETLQRQWRESVENEKNLRQKALDAQEDLRKEQTALSDARQLCETRRVENEYLQAKVKRLEEEAQAAPPRPPEAPLAAKAGDDKPQPKCGCVVM